MQRETTSREADSTTSSLCLESAKQNDRSGTSNGNKNETGALVALAAASLVQFIVMGIHNSFGIMYSQILEEFHWRKSTSAFIGSAAIGFNFLVSPVGTQLCESFNPKVVTIVGGLISVAGLLGTSFVSTNYSMFLSYSVVWGIGSSLCYSSTYVVVGRMFNTHMAVAMGVLAAGSGLGQFTISPSIESMLESYGWKITMRTLSVLACCLILTAFTYRESTAHRQVQSVRRNWRQLFDCSLWCIPGFLILTLSLVVFNFGYYVPIIHAPQYAIKMGFPRKKASWLISFMSISSVISRITFGVLADFPRINRLLMFQVCLGMVAVSTILCPFVATEYAGFAVYMIIFGIGEGCLVGTVPTITACIVGRNRLPHAIGLLFFSFAGPLMAGPFFAGWLYSETNRYQEAFFAAGGTMVVCLFTLSFIHCLPKERSTVECVTDSHDIDLVNQSNEIDSFHHASQRHSPNNAHFDTAEGLPLCVLRVTSV